MFGSLPSVTDFDRLKDEYTGKGFFTTATMGRSKPGKLKNVCQNVKFFTDGYFDFEEKLWRSDGEIIDNSRWYISDPSKNEFKKYPILLDRFAYVKRITARTRLQNMNNPLWWPGIDAEDVYFFSTNSCQFTFLMNSDSSRCPTANFICGEHEKPDMVHVVENLSYEDAIKHCQTKNTSLCEYGLNQRNIHIIWPILYMRHIISDFKIRSIL